MSRKKTMVKKGRSLTSSYSSKKYNFKRTVKRYRRSTQTAVSGGGEAARRSMRSDKKTPRLSWRGFEVPGYFGRGTNRYATNGRIPGVIIPDLTAKQQENIGGALHAGFQLTHNERKYLFNQNDCVAWRSTKTQYPTDGFEQMTEKKGFIRPMMSRIEPLEMSCDKSGECLDLANTLSEFWFHTGHPDRDDALAHMCTICGTARNTHELYEMLWTVPSHKN